MTVTSEKMTVATPTTIDTTVKAVSVSTADVATHSDVATHPLRRTPGKLPALEIPMTDMDTTRQRGGHTPRILSVTTINMHNGTDSIIQVMAEPASAPTTASKHHQHEWQ